MRLRADRERRPLHPAAGGALVLCGVTLLGLARFFPFYNLPRLCLFNLWTGHPCLTCGMTRSWVAMAHGRALDAVAQNPLGAALFLTTIAIMFYGIGRQLRLLPAVALDASDREWSLLRWGAVFAIAANWAYVAASSA